MARSPDKPPAGPPDYARMRRPEGKENLELSDAAKALLASLPKSDRPGEVAEKFPRILNHVAERWELPRQFYRYVNQLLEVDDKRGARRGFPFEVLAELTALREYYADNICAPIDEDTWSGSQWQHGRKF